MPWLCMCIRDCNCVPVSGIDRIGFPASQHTLRETALTHELSIQIEWMCSAPSPDRLLCRDASNNLFQASTLV
ncbi:unnamed protein product [Periconia digitata]|uniref:Uncharacterized protein n=1 Tax=Periconia digitata TaxID=1303443 RepID=A0A9W4U3B5_9PLEO|nr:unnamed protein product [Periconia digitata]